jgi:surface protein
MKKFLWLIPIIAFGCSSIKKIDVTDFNTNDNVIFYKTDSVAILKAIEYSIDDNKYTKEMTFRLVNMEHADKIKNLLYYIHDKHKDWEIEIDYPINEIK